PSTPSLNHRVVSGRGIEDVVPRPPEQDVVPGAADEGIVSLAPDEHVIALAAIHGQLDRAGGQSGSRHRVVAGQGVDLQLIVARLGAGEVDLGRQTLDVDAARVADDGHAVIPRGALDDDGVRLAVAGATARWAPQVEVDLGDVGAGQVVDGDGVGAAQGVDVDGFDAGGVHRHVADVAGQPQVAAVGRQLDFLGDGGAVEDHRVLAAPAIDGVAAVAGVPGEGVVAGAQEGHVVTLVANDQVVAGAANEDVVAGAAVLG